MNKLDEIAEVVRKQKIVNLQLSLLRKSNEKEALIRDLRKLDQDITNAQNAIRKLEDPGPKPYTIIYDGIKLDTPRPIMVHEFISRDDVKTQSTKI